MKRFNPMRICLLPVMGALLGCACSKSVKDVKGQDETAGTPPPQTASAGDIDRYRIYSPEMDDTVTIDVWTPEGYPGDDGHRYPVIYMHDGQNLFDASTTWNGQSWEMDSVVSELVEAGEIEAPVIIGIHSVAETRVGDLMPQKAKDYITSTPDSALRDFLEKTPLRGDAYAAFIVNTLRPAMDAAYRLTANADSTFVMGSSMGGLMSVYTMSEYPDLFGGAGCLSTHWVGTLDGDPTFANAMYDYLSEHMPRDGRHRLYFDHGTESIDSLYGPANERVVALARSLGYSERPADGTRPTLDNYVAEGAGHEERFWAARVKRPLRFLLGKKQAVGE